MDVKELQNEAFKCIRREVNNIEEANVSNDELAGFVKGICALQREIYSYCDKSKVGDSD